MMRAAARCRAVLGSGWFLGLTIGFFVLQATWIAISADYPQAFDEAFHTGLIKTYAHYWLPFLSGQPPDANVYGAVARDPSYFYHYLMSFPYRIIAVFVHSQMWQIISLRLLNVALFAAGLVLFRRLLKRAGLSAPVANVIIFIISFIPVVPQLAGQVNYDNLLLPLTAWICLLTLNLIDQIRAGRPKLQDVLVLLTVCLLTSVVKYEFLPIFLAVVLFCSVFAWRQLRLRSRWRNVWRDALATWRKQHWGRRLALLLACLVALGLVLQRDGYNAVRYHNLAPECSQVLSEKACEEYPVWRHDNNAHRELVRGTTHVNQNPLAYLAEWTYWLWYRLFFVINGPTHRYTNYPPLPLPAAAFGLLVVAGAGALIVCCRRLLPDNPYMVFFGLVTLIYLLALLMEGYLKYRATAVLELMNGRYLLPVLPLGAVLGYRALALLLKRRAAVMPLVAVVAVVCMLDGGGVFSFLSRSNHNWNWNNHTIQQMNDTARRAVSPVIFDGPHGYHTSHWFFN